MGKARYVHSSEAINLRFYDSRRKPLIKCHRCQRDLPEHYFPILSMMNAPDGADIGTLHPFCAPCRSESRGAWITHPLYSIELENYWREALKILRSGARTRSIALGIDRDDLIGLYIKQEGKCALTGLPMSISKKDGSRNYGAPSCDRIDSRGNYVLGNIQIILRAVNLMKNDLPQEIFLDLCERVSSQRLSSQIG